VVHRITERGGKTGRRDHDERVAQQIVQAFYAEGNTPNAAVDQPAGAPLQRPAQWRGGGVIPVTLGGSCPDGVVALLTGMGSRRRPSACLRFAPVDANGYFAQ